MSSIIVKGPADAMHRKAIKTMGKGLLSAMIAGKKKGDHLLITGPIAAGPHTFTVSESPDGFVQLDLVPGAEA